MAQKPKKPAKKKSTESASRLIDARIRELGDWRGKFSMQAQVKNFTGSVDGEFLNGIFDIHGKLRSSAFLGLSH